MDHIAGRCKGKGPMKRPQPPQQDAAPRPGSCGPGKPGEEQEEGAAPAALRAFAAGAFRRKPA